jgi:hypothetical protein
LVCEPVVLRIAGDGQDVHERVIDNYVHRGINRLLT